MAGLLLHEDDQGMISLVPAENRADRVAVVETARASPQHRQAIAFDCACTSGYPAHDGRTREALDALAGCGRVAALVPARSS